MLATLNSRQIVDEIVKDTVTNNDPHDAVQISPDIVLASRPLSVAPALAPEITARPEPKIDPAFTLKSFTVDTSADISVGRATGIPLPAGAYAGAPVLAGALVLALRRRGAAV